jgi:hypothetical protein
MGSDLKQAYFRHDTAEIEGAPPDSAREGWVLRVIRKTS